MKWDEVAVVHRSWEGISVVNGSPTSILCNTRKSGPYPDEIADAEITYYVNGPSKTRGAETLLAAVGTGVRVRVFEKAGVNDWRDLGEWTPIVARATSVGRYTGIVLRRPAPG